MFTTQGVNTLRNLKEGTQGFVKLILTFMIPDIISNADRGTGCNRFLLTPRRPLLSVHVRISHRVAMRRAATRGGQRATPPGDPARPTTERSQRQRTKRRGVTFLTSLCMYLAVCLASSVFPVPNRKKSLALEVRKAVLPVQRSASRADCRAAARSDQYTSFFFFLQMHSGEEGIPANSPI